MMYVVVVEHGPEALEIMHARCMRPVATVSAPATGAVLGTLGIRTAGGWGVVLMGPVCVVVLFTDRSLLWLMMMMMAKQTIPPGT